VQLNDVDHDLLRQLAALSPGEGKVLTIYVDLNPADFGTQPARAGELDALLDEARRRIRDGATDRADRLALLADVDRTYELLRRNGNATWKGAHALAIFSCPSRDLHAVLRLPEAVPATVVVDDVPWLDPLVGRERPRRCLALVSRRATRVLLDGPDGRLREVVGTVDDVHGRHDQGGWSQSRYERSIEEEVRRHLERAAQTLFSLHRRHRFDLLAIGASAELWPELERLLHPYVRERTVGRFDVDVEHAGPDTALTAASPLLEAAEERRIGELLDRLRRGVAHDERAAVGLEPVLEAIEARRVAALLYEPGLDAHVREPAIAAALLQGAEVVALRDREELDPLGGIAAVLRF
jgi:peptide chain release factor subunit 1